MNYIKLVNFEVQRFFKLFIALVVFVTTAQIIAAVMSAWRFNNRAERTMMEEKLLAQDFVNKYSGYSILDLLNDKLFQISIVFAAAMLIIYVFVIWYRDWFGKASFIYRLLMLPTERRNVYFAKLTAIVLFVLFLAGLQVVLLELAKLITKALIPAELYIERGVLFTYSYDILSIIIPQTFMQFLLSYGMGIAIVAVVFTAILLERSFHLKGIILAGIYITLSQAVLFIPLLIEGFTDYFYINELFMMLIVMAILVFVVAVALANYLLKKKIQV